MKTSTKGVVKKLQKITSIEENQNKIITSSSELNNVLGWGVIPWSVVLLSWEPWIWKSTLTLQLANFIDKQVTYISGEETPNQISARANRLWVKWENMMILWESCIEDILETLKWNTSEVLILDSISVMHSNNIAGTSGSITQVKYISELLVAYAKTTNTAIFIIWHITKDGNLAWPKTLEHMVDTVLYFEWDKYDNLRILRSLKNRFWPTNEIAIFTMEETWLKDLKNPWLEFINSKEPTIGSSLSITIEWKRPIVVETESLTTYTKFWYPKRSTRWINSSKLDLIVAVLWKYTDIKLDSHDVYTNIVRWLKVEEPWIDLSVAVSIISSKINKPIPKDTIFIWEISLTGKIKKPIHIETRIKEAEKIWFKKIFIPESKKQSKINKVEIIKIENIWELVKKLSDF
jgi:DNA repair protein RadA/Sms